MQKLNLCIFILAGKSLFVNRQYACNIYVMNFNFSGKWKRLIIMTACLLPLIRPSCDAV